MGGNDTAEFVIRRSYIRETGTLGLLFNKSIKNNRFSHLTFVLEARIIAALFHLGSAQMAYVQTSGY